MNTCRPRTVVPKSYPEQTFDLHGLDGISDSAVRLAD